MLFTVGGTLLMLMQVANLSAVDLVVSPVKGSAGLQETEVREDGEAGLFNRSLKECVGEDGSAVREEQCIDKALDECIEEFQSTAGQVACIVLATELWEKKMKTAYEQLSDIMDADQKKALASSQDKWEKSVEADIHLLIAVQGPGTMWVPSRPYKKYEEIKLRTGTLRSHLEMLQQAQD
ncbi:MAG: DUF1311 domain-containing protein [Aridibacter famidurans]|nr:DUF1311 domain-containing protein [Aridibacter famidurans]